MKYSAAERRGAAVGGGVIRSSSLPGRWSRSAPWSTASEPSVASLDAQRRAIDVTLAVLTPLERWFSELWYNARPMLLESGLPALLMGCSFPLSRLPPFATH